MQNCSFPKDVQSALLGVSHTQYRMSSNRKAPKSRSAARKQQKQQQQTRKKQPPAAQRVMAPVSSRQQMRVAPALVTSSRPRSDGRITVSHRELVTEIKSFTDFTVESWNINPGLSATFPWLCGIARNYDCYQFRSLSFEFSTMKSTQSTGSVMMAVDYDAADANPATKQELLTFHNAVTGALWAPLHYVCDPLDLKKFGPQRFNRTSLKSNTDVKTYDLGKLVVASNGCSAADNGTLLGELWVNYVVDLITPGSIEAGPPDSLLVTSTNAGGAEPANPLPFVTTTVNGVSPIKFVANGKFILPDEGEYLLDVIAKGTGITGGPVWTYGSGVTPNPVTATINAAATEVNQTYGFKASSSIPENNFILFNNLSASTLASVAVRIARYASYLG